MKKLVILSILFLTLLTSLTYAERNVTVYYFWGDGCPHCAKATPFLYSLEDKYPELRIEAYEV
ncbi:MAG: hypothetical protein QF824_05015 [Candidatus Woesearchaeota archaeon]|jgi:thiol-disulfide isomerase/thioredoxin|nr:hypothetical protein [Candidatus Woesearchaeota archaeon]